MSVSGISTLKPKIAGETTTIAGVTLRDFSLVELNDVTVLANSCFSFDIDGLWKLKENLIINGSSMNWERYIIYKEEQELVLEIIQDNFYIFEKTHSFKSSEMSYPPPPEMDMDINGTSELFQSMLYVPLDPPMEVLTEMEHPYVPIIENDSSIAQWDYKSAVREDTYAQIRLNRGATYLANSSTEHRASPMWCEIFVGKTMNPRTIHFY